MTLERRLESLERLHLLPADDTVEWTKEELERRIAALFEAAEGPDADRLMPGATMTTRQRAARVRELLARARRRMEQAG